MNTNIYDKTEKFASVHLGKKSLISKGYDPSLLVAIPRCENRLQYDIKNCKLPFDGTDIWHAYEFSALSTNGMPVTKVMKIKYPCNNEFLIESKSLKLYLNSFNMSRFGKTTEDCLEICKTLIEKDLSEKLQTKVEINFLDNDIEREEIFRQFKNIMNYVNEEDLSVEMFKEAPQILAIEELQNESEYYLMFDSLRSNCRVTHQPDFGDVFIYYKSKKHIKEDSLVKYLCSFRSEYHFHEECCEMIYKRLHDLLDKNDKLMVSALYTRRGGIDICPSRWSKNCMVSDINKLIDINTFARYGIKQ